MFDSLNAKNVHNSEWRVFGIALQIENFGFVCSTH